MNGARRRGPDSMLLVGCLLDVAFEHVAMLLVGGVPRGGGSEPSCCCVLGSKKSAVYTIYL